MRVQSRHHIFVAHKWTHILNTSLASVFWRSGWSAGSDCDFCPSDLCVLMLWLSFLMKTRTGSWVCRSLSTVWLPPTTPMKEVKTPSLLSPTIFNVRFSTSLLWEHAFVSTTCQVYKDSRAVAFSDTFICLFCFVLLVHKECALEDEVFEDGAETQMECNKCVCACGNWVCTALACKGGFVPVHLWCRNVKGMGFTFFFLLSPRRASQWGVGWGRRRERRDDRGRVE